MIQSINASNSFSSSLSPNKTGVHQSNPTASFELMMKELASNTIDTLKTAENTATAGVRGQIPVQDVVASIMPAEQALQAAIAIRDKVVAAYLDLTKMAI